MSNFSRPTNIPNLPASAFVAAGPLALLGIRGTFSVDPAEIPLLFNALRPATIEQRDQIEARIIETLQDAGATHSEGASQAVWYHWGTMENSDEAERYMHHAEIAWGTTTKHAGSQHSLKNPYSVKCLWQSAAPELPFPVVQAMFEAILRRITGPR